MGRKIYVSSDMSADEDVDDVAKQEPLAALLWPWFLTALDDWGRSSASPSRLKNEVFPGNDLVTIEVIERALQLFDDTGLLTLYEVRGKTYMAVVPMDKWFKWQTHIRQTKRDKDESKCPPPPENLREGARGCAQVREGARRARVLTPSPSPSPSPTVVVRELSVTKIDPPVEQDQRQPTGGGGEEEIKELEGPNLVAAFSTAGILMPSPYQIERLGKWLEDGMEYGGITLACEIAARANIRRLDYIEGVLRRWHDAGIRTRTAAEAENQAGARASPTTPAADPSAPEPEWMQDARRAVERMDKS